MAEKNIKLFEDFPSISTEAWDAKINADLKGKDYERALVWRTNEGFNVRPYYRQENLETITYLDALPGEFPFVRGNKKKTNRWFIRQDIKVTDLEKANAKTLEILNKGVDSLGFVFESSKEITKEEFAVLLKDVCLEAIEVNLEACNKSCETALNFIAYVNELGIDPAAVNASVNHDPIGCFAMSGMSKCVADEPFEAVVKLINETAAFEGVKTIGINGRNFNNAGASIVHELGFSLAIGAEYLNKVSEKGLDVAEVAKKMKFNFGVGSNYFMEIAKLRAARLLWAQIVKAYGVASDEACKMFVHSETSQWNKTFYDPYVNMLRSQTEAMSAILGGTDSMTVLPFDVIYEDPTVFAERIARNQQSLLKEESYFDKIVDPGAGSYYIESLTVSIAEQAWKLFLEVEDKGGFIAAFREGFVQTQVKAMAAKRNKDISIRKENILGINQFPNFTEKMELDVDQSVFEAADCSSEDSDVETLKTYRGAQPFERLRVQTDKYSKENKRPLAFMLTIGDLNFRKARAQFACNFFAVAGYQVQDNNGFTSIEEGVRAAKEADADIIVICSSDDEYAEFAPAANDLVKEEAIFVVAGNPACKGNLEAKGIENFIHVKSNLLEDLTGYQKKLGIA